MQLSIQVFAFLMFFAPAAAIMDTAGLEANNPIKKVVTMLKEMKAQVEKEGEEDTVAYDKYACWCKTNDAEKTAAIEGAETKIDDLTTAIEEYAALMAKLKGEIEKLEGDIADAKAALETAAAQRDKEKAEFETEEADMKNALSALQEAVAILEKVQFAQKQGHTEEAGQMLIQVRSIVRHKLSHYRDVMQADLWDFLSTMTLNGDQQSFMAKQHDFSAIQQEPKKIEGGGAAAGAKSYNSRSGQIFGILQQMMEEFGKDLSEAQKSELRSMISFEKLKAAKNSEIDAATKLLNQKSEELAKATQDDAQAKEDLEDTKTQMGEDQEFLMQLKKDCKIADEEYAARMKARGDEVIALSEALKILTDDDARDLFGRSTFFFLQTESASLTQARIKAKIAAENQARTQAVQRLLAAAKRTKNFQLANLAVSTQLDKFTKVKEAMDKFKAELKKQQKDEYEKNEFCKKELDSNEDTTKVKENEKEDLEDALADTENSIKKLTGEIDSLKKEVAEMKVSLKRAGEDRKAENQEFQAAVADQRAVVNILNKVLARLKMFYEKKGLLQTGMGAEQDPPPKPKATVEKSGGAGGVMQLIQMIIEDAGREEAELVMSEQKAQEAYAGFVVETKNCIDACDTSIAEKEEALAADEADKAESEAAIMAVTQELTSLKDLNLGLHADCDFLMENFEIRQTARKEEMDAIDEAKAILSGAK